MVSYLLRPKFSFKVCTVQQYRRLDGLFFNLQGVQESIPRNRFRKPIKPGGPVRQLFSYTRFLAPVRYISTELEFLKSLWGLGTEEEEGYCTGPPGYIGWRNSFLGIDSGAPYTFKNTSSVDCIKK